MTQPASPFAPEPSTEWSTLEAPTDLVEKYLELIADKRRIEEQIAFIRGELEMIAAATLRDDSPRARFAAGGGRLAARLYPTCSFDRAEVGHFLQRAGRLADVATLQGTTLARFLAKEPALNARLGALVRHRRGVMLVAATP